MQPGDVVIVQVCHADGQVYRRWQSAIEEISDETIITLSPPGKPIEYELDVICQPGEAAQIVDEDEFAEAIIKYGYTPEFQAHCRQAALAACVLAEGWSPHGINL